MKGVLSTTDLDDASLVAKAKSSPGLVGRDLVREVVIEPKRDWCDNLSDWDKLESSAERANAQGREFHVVALDFGMKWNIARHLHDLGCKVTILPGTEATAESVLALNPCLLYTSDAADE